MSRALRTGLIGRNISRTRLPRALEIMCAEYGFELEFEMIDTATLPEFDFIACIEDLRARGWDGVSVTHPFKTHAARYAGETLAGEMQLLGAANVLRFAPRLSGTNTDFTGAGAALDAAGLGKLGNVTMIGAGGVARALARAIRVRQVKGAALFVHDLDHAASVDLCDTIAKARIPIKAEALPEAIRNSDGLVNATPVGMAEHPGSVFDPDLIDASRWAMDAIYTPPMTEFLKDATRHGLITLSGFELFRHMALGTFAALSGQRPDADLLLPRLAELRPD